MANRRQDKKCVDIRICVENDIDEEIIKFQNAHKAKHPRDKYNKPDAAVDLLRKLLFPS